MERGAKFCLYSIGFLVVVIISMYVWKITAVKTVEKQAQQVISENTREFLRLTATPLGWAVRKEMLTGNYGQINEYLVQFVKEPGIKQIMVVKSDGIIAVSTDKKLEGTAFSSLYPKEILDYDKTTVSDGELGNIQVIVPIMGFDKKLGLLLLIYKPQTNRLL
jgi:hypothetical protein